jgi:hypothetical protein
MRRIPNFFLVGAPKSGTTAMSEYLRMHPQVFVSDPKEPAFFSDDIQPSRFATLDEYLRLFAGAMADHAVLTDASTNYIHSHRALHRIYSLWPQAKLGVMLRRPAELVYAFHGEMIRSGLENEIDFQKAWGLQAQRALRDYPPQTAAARHKLQYGWIGSVGTQMERLLSIFPRDQIQVIIFDDFRADPRSSYIRLLEFLGVEADDRTDFPVFNQARTYRSLWLNQSIWRMRRSLRKPLQRVYSLLGVKGSGILTAVERFNLRAQARPELPPEFKEELTRYFAPEVRKLERLVDRDLSPWRQNEE